MSFSLCMLGYSQIPDPHRHNTPRKSGVGGRGERGGREGGPENIPEEEEEGESRAKSPPCCGSEELK